LVTFHIGAASAQEEEVLEEIIVTGTRSLNRTVANSPVPVDVFKGEEFRNMGTADMDDMLRTLVPAYNVERYPVGAERSLIRPATLRGLPPENTLILINGKRRHRSGALSGGTQGPDISAIPAIAFERVEVLRDAASAQYGSDAIAGVINFIAREDSDGIAVSAQFGEYYEGDGQSAQIAANVGFPLTGNGFVNLSLEYAKVDSAERNEQRFDAQALQDAGASGVPDPAQRFGQPAIDSDWKFFVNSAVDVGNDSEIYAFGNYSSREVTTTFFWRGPNAFSPNVYHDSRAFSGDRLVLDVTPDGTGNCPQAGTPEAIGVPFVFPTPEEIAAEEAVVAQLIANPNCWAATELYPVGFRPSFGAEIEDYSAVVGFRGEKDSGFRYDFSASYGVSNPDYWVFDTLNPSLGPDTPTSFDPGANQQTETNLNADFAWLIDVSGFAAPLNLATGLEWRDESFEVLAGETASWLQGPYWDQGAAVGSAGYGGFPPEQANKWSRANWAAFVDLEADITESFLLGVAVRYEDFEDFGSTTNYKIALRYAINEVFAVRASHSTGFRAPTPGQANLTRAENRPFEVEDGIFQLAQGGLIPPTDPIAMYFGGEALEPEESTNYSAGFSLEPLNRLTITADYFHIDVENRIGESPNFRLTPEDVEELVDRGVPGASTFSFINFYTNGVETTTKGFDVVATYSIDWAGGDSDLSVAWNQTDTEVVSEKIPSRNFRLDLGNRPRNRGILTIRHTLNNWRFLLRASYYDEWADARAQTLPETAPLVCSHPSDPPTFPESTDPCFDSSWVLDAEVAYTWSDRYTLVIGADNVLDEYPQQDPNILSPFSTGRLYPPSSPIGFTGGFWYVRLNAEF
jgi:iron complex outermembrane receptor protein